METLCQCHSGTDITCLCQPNGSTWLKCPEKLRYVKSMVLNNHLPGSNNLLFQKTLTKVVDLRLMYRHLLQIFNLDQIEVNQFLSAWRLQELDELDRSNESEHPIRMENIEYYFEYSLFDDLCQMLYQLSRQQLNSLRDIPYLSGFIEEALGHYNNAIVAFHKNVTTHKKLYAYLGYLYENNIFVTDQTNQFFEYDLEFYEHIECLRDYLCDPPLPPPDALCDYIRKAMAWKKQNDSLLTENQQLREQLAILEAHIDYAPDGVGYHEAKTHFDRLAST